MSVVDIEMVYAASKEKLLALAAHQHHLNANSPTLTYTTSLPSQYTGSVDSPPTTRSLTSIRTVFASGI